MIGPNLRENEYVTIAYKAKMKNGKITKQLEEIGIVGRFDLEKDVKDHVKSWKSGLSIHEEEQGFEAKIFQYRDGKLHPIT